MAIDSPLIEQVAQTGSTNSDLLNRLSAGEPAHEGHWLVADRQMAGRGRLGRQWQDGLGNFMGSTMVEMRDADPPRPSLALVAGIAVHDAVRSFMGNRHSELALKWPNDLLAGRAKIAGILLEAAQVATVVGVGVNLVSAPKVPGRSTTALAALGVEVSRDVFARSLASSFATEVARWRADGLPATIARWLALSFAPGTPMTVGEAGTGRPRAGHFAGLTGEGALRLRLVNGDERVIHAGEVDLIKECADAAGG